MQESACRADSGPTNLRIESLSFNDIPGQSKLFLQYQNDPLSLRKFYPSAVAKLSELSGRIPEIIGRYKVDREVLCDILLDQNSRFGACVDALANIDLLRQDATVAIVSGQQTGLFTGPLYTIYKALSAIRLADEMRAKGLDVVPVFWAATEDHDFEEISVANLIGKDGEVVLSKIAAGAEFSEWPVGSIPLDYGIERVVSDLFESMPATEFTGAVRDLLSACWRPGETIGKGFCKQIGQLLGRFGLIVLDPHDPRIKNLVAPVYTNAIRNSSEINGALVARGNQLVADGLHAQVNVDDKYFPLFWHDDLGKRRALKRIDKDTLRVSGDRTEFSTDQLTKYAEKETTRLSPGVMLRSVVQDFLLPTLCYFGGAAEIAYFAQNSEVYRILDRPVTPILHRQSFTIVEAKHSRTLEKFDLNFVDLFTGLDSLRPQLVEQFIDPAIAGTFTEVEQRVNAELNRLDRELSAVDITLAENLAKRRRKILYHIGALRSKAYRAAVVRSDTANRQLSSLFDELLPFGCLQERTLNITAYLNRHGEYIIDWLYDAIDLDDNGHRLIYL